MATDESYRDNEEDREFEGEFGEDFEQDDPEFLIEFDDVSDHSSGQELAGVPDEDEIFGIFDEEDEEKEMDEDGSFSLDSDEDAEEFAFLLEEEDEDEFLGPLERAEGSSSSTRTDEELEFIWEDEASDGQESKLGDSSVVFGGEDQGDADLTGFEEILGADGGSQKAHSVDSLEEDEFSFEIEGDPAEVSFSSSFIASEEDELGSEDVRELEEEIFGLEEQNTPPEESLEFTSREEAHASTLAEEEEYLFDSGLGDEQGMSTEEVGGLFNENGGHNPDLDTFDQEDLGQEALQNEIFEDEIFAEEEEEEVPAQGSRFGIPSAQEAARWGDPSIFGQSSEEPVSEEEPVSGGEPVGAYDLEGSEGEGLPPEEYMQASGAFQVPSGSFEIVEDPRDLQSGTFQGSELGSESVEGFEEDVEEFDPIYGKEAEEKVEEEFCSDEEPDYSDLEAIAPEEEHFFGEEATVIGGFQGKSAGRKLLAVGMAASILVLLSVGVLIWNPDVKAVKDLRGVLGMNKGHKQRLVVEVTKVGRPKIPLVLPSGKMVVEGPVRIVKGPRAGSRNPGIPHKVPSMPGKKPKSGPKVSLRLSPKVSSKLLDLGKIVALIGRGIRKGTQLSIERARAQGRLPIPQPGPGLNPAKGQPARPLVAKGPEVQAPQHVPDPVKDTEPGKSVSKIPSRENPEQNQPKTILAQEQPVEAPKPAPRAAFFDTKALRRGIQALAQLRNGNFFVGRIYKVKPVEIILSLKHGEVSFAPDDLKKIVPLVESEAKLLRGKELGVVRLRNRNKLVGRILAESPDFIAIETDEKSKIFLPRTSVLQVERKKPTPITFGEEEDWSPEAFPIPEPSKEGESSLPALPVVEKEEGDGPAIQVQIGNPKEEGSPAEPGK